LIDESREVVQCGEGKTFICLFAQCRSFQAISFINPCRKSFVVAAFTSLVQSIRFHFIDEANGALDTSDHVRFGFHDGNHVKNNFPSIWETKNTALADV
jgi:hypothetical protein